MIPALPRGFSHPMRIGSGAFASVYRVHQTALDRNVALKFIYEKDRLQRSKLLTEARTQAKMRVDCVPQVFDAFEWHNSVCCAMEWIKGVSFDVVLKSPLSGNDRIFMAGLFIRALAAIHRIGFAHRDLKPENILLSSNNTLFLVDFGFSRNIDDAGRSSSTTAKGTPTYMAPELWSSDSGETDLLRADVFAAGKILVQLLDGTACAHFPIRFTSVNPLARPASGVEIGTLWEREATPPEEGKTLQTLNGQIIAETLSMHLLDAAKQLLAAHRFDEAYWLLVESLEENGNNHEAVELLGAFPEYTKKQRSRISYALFVLIVLAGAIPAFFIGFQSRKHSDASYPSPVHKSTTFKLPPLTKLNVSARNATLRRDSLKTGTLFGTLQIRGLKEGYRVTIDNDTLSTDTGVNLEHYLPSGKSEVTVYDHQGKITHREMVEILPFQTKAIGNSFHQKGKK